MAIVSAFIYQGGRVDCARKVPHGAIGICHGPEKLVRQLLAPHLGALREGEPSTYIPGVAKACNMTQALAALRAVLEEMERNRPARLSLGRGR